MKICQQYRRPTFINENISIIDSENMELKSHLLSLIHEYKHLKDIVFKQPIDMFHNTTHQSQQQQLQQQLHLQQAPPPAPLLLTSTTTPEVLSAISLQPSLSSVSSSNNNQDDPLHQYSSIPSPGSYQTTQCSRWFCVNYHHHNISGNTKIIFVVVPMLMSMSMVVFS